MKKLLKYSDSIFGMSTIRGNKVKVPNKLPFSFYFSARNGKHGIRVKPIWNPDRMNIEDAGNLELHGEWIYTPGRNDNPSSKDIRYMIGFFRKYKVLFSAVWEGELQEDSLQDYFRGFISFSELLKEFDFYEDYSSILQNTTTVTELETIVRNYNIFNMND